MPGRKIALTVLAVGILLVTAACVTTNSPLETHSLQMISAGHTGCAPAENEISNVSTSLDGSGTWNTSCKGKAYLCSAFLGVGKSESYSCAPVAH